MDCFKNASYAGGFKADTIKSNNVLWGEKIWRKISLEDKENFSVFNTGNQCAEVSLFEIIKFGMLVKKLSVFSSDNFGERMNIPLDTVQFIKRITCKDTVTGSVFYSEGNETKEVVISNRYLYGSDVKSYLLKENWIYNSYSGKMEKRIIGLAPLVYDKKTKSIVPLFWIYYNEWKELFASFEARNFRSADKISFNDVFTGHYFHSSVFKESNMFDRNLNSTVKGKDFFNENEVINKKINDLEEDLFPK